MRGAIFALLLSVAPSSVFAQGQFVTPTPGQSAIGAVQMCLNASNQAVPISSGNCANGSGGAGAATTPAAPGYTAEVGSSNAAAGIVPAVTASGTSLVAKAAQGNLYSAYAVNGTTTAGFLAVVNATAAPASGAAISPFECVSMPANTASGAGMASLFFGAGPPDAFSTGIVLLVSTSCATYTPGALSAFIEGRVR